MENLKSSQATSYPGTLHFIPPNLSAFEQSKPLARTASINTLLWIGGMFDTYGFVEYPYVLNHALPPLWSLMAASLSSAGMSWGVKSIATDAADIAKIVGYIKERRPSGKVVLMGHSTGCQDCMEYVVGKGNENRPGVDGVILQAPCSDRESMEDQMPEEFKKEADQLALKMCREGHDNDSMPNRLTKSSFGRMAITARRWLDVSSPGPAHTGADDYFSSDLGVERFRGTFGKFPTRTPLLILMSGKDEFVPMKIDKGDMVKTWTAVVKNGGGCVDEDSSGVVEGASHGLNGDQEDIVLDLVKRVVAFIGKLDEGKFEPNGARM